MTERHFAERSLDAASGGTEGLPAHRFAQWAAKNGVHLESPLEVSQVEGGHSCLTYVVTDAQGQKVVVRRPPLGHILESAHDVVREHRIVAALKDTEVAVAPTLGVCDDTEVIGAPFFVMQFVDGGVLHDRSDVDAVTPHIAQRTAAAQSLVTALAALHSVDIEEVDLGDLSRRTGYLDRQLHRWSRQWERTKTRELGDMDVLHRWLVEQRPEPSEEVRIVHGDFRLGNAILGPDGAVVAMLDWELCTLGEPLADLAYLLRSWVGPGEATPPHLEQPTRAGGFPSRDELVAAYERASGRSVTDLDYWVAFNAWRSAAISEGVLRRYTQGSMGQHQLDLGVFRRSVEVTADAGMRAAGLR